MKACAGAYHVSVECSPAPWGALQWGRISRERMLMRTVGIDPTTFG